MTITLGSTEKPYGCNMFDWHAKPFGTGAQGKELDVLGDEMRRSQGTAENFCCRELVEDVTKS